MCLKYGELGGVGSLEWEGGGHSIFVAPSVIELLLITRMLGVTGLFAESAPKRAPKLTVHHVLVEQRRGKLAACTAE